MAITVLDKKTKVADLMGELFRKVPKPQRARAEAALLRANPHFGRRRNLDAGTVVFTPADWRVAPLAPKPARRAPPTSLLAGIRASLDAAGDQIKETLAAEGRELEAASALLRSRELRGVVRGEETGPLVELVVKALSDREKELEAARTFFAETLAKASRDLDRWRLRLG